MIISASRRTDIPAFYTEWFMRRIRAGCCDVPNPFNPRQLSHISLRPADVEAIVFWTRHATPLLGSLEELDQRGYRYYVLYTLLDNPALLDPGLPSLDRRLAALRALARRIGPDRVVWRYDPIVISDATGPAFHADTFARLAAELEGYTRRCVVSFVDLYPRLRKRLNVPDLARINIREPTPDDFEALLPILVPQGRLHGMTVTSCAERFDLTPYGIEHGKCIDDELIARLFLFQPDPRKDPGQRKACRCIRSRDIGSYDTCLFGCRYCYATTSLDRARAKYAQHDPTAPAMVSPFGI